MRRAAFLLVLAGALAAPNNDGWRQLWKRSPTDFATHASEKLHATLDRLLQGPRVRSRAPRKATDDTGALQLLLQVWHKRDDPTYLLELVERLALLVQDDRGVDELEAYLPQIGHLLLRLPSDSLLATVLERFSLRVSETNVHWALQLIWTVYANLEENRPERRHSMAKAPSWWCHSSLPRPPGTHGFEPCCATCRLSRSGHSGSSRCGCKRVPQSASVSAAVK